MTTKLRSLFVPVVLVICILMLMSLAQRAPSETAMRVMVYANEKGIPFSAYPDSLIDLLERNPETEEFVLNYPFRPEEETVDLRGYDLERSMPLFLQWDPQWGYLSYSGDFVAVTGSGPMCLAMAGCFVTGGDERFHPDRVVDFAQQNGYTSNKGNGSERSLITQGGAALGLDVKELPIVEQKIASYLQNGDPIIALLREGEFSDTGHYILITDFDDGMLIINDPFSRINSQKKWYLEELSGQIRALWVIRE